MAVYRIGLDVGSTTVKVVVLDNSLNLLYEKYTRHYSDVGKTVKGILTELGESILNSKVTMRVTGSGAMDLTEWLEVPFIQEVIALTKSIETLIPETDVAIELGGEDAKITYLGDSLEQRMNSICAGGTGAFIDQMATLLETNAQGLNNLAKNYKNIYSIASRCGVFAKTDVQSLVNQGVSKEDISVSILQSVVNQTISNLACGRPIEGKVAFLGGPLYFLPELRYRFIETLGIKDDNVIYPHNSQLYVAIGAAISSFKDSPLAYKDILKNLNKDKSRNYFSVNKVEPLFNNTNDYINFRKRHSKNKIIDNIDKDYSGDVYLGIDAGSTTTKAVLLNNKNEIIYEFYGNNKGKPLDQSINILKEIYDNYPNINIKQSTVTGYGEEFIRAALKIDIGEVETISHYKGASLFLEDVDFILDIGGQDMKAMRIRDGVIEDILLNEACSSGCGSFIETFAKSVNMSIEDFTQEAIFAKNPVDLGSRCTVFMNSMVKQAQKEGATIGDISAGLSNSVIRNAVQKVIKIRDPRELGNNIVVQGGTFYGDAVLRSFEKIVGRDVVRPNKAGLMGAIGAAIIAKENNNKKSNIISKEELKKFNYKVKHSNCSGCGNKCKLNINIFSDNRRYITGNRCEKGIGKISKEIKLPNLYKYKYDRLFSIENISFNKAYRGVVGIPRVLNIYENYPFWLRFFNELGYRVELSEESSRKTYEKGLESIPSETACYPAKIVHGHIENLLLKDIDFIFYPSIFYEENECDSQDNHLNCPVVTGYPELIKHNIKELEEKEIEFLNPFLTFDNTKSLQRNLYNVFKEKGISYSEIKNAVFKGKKELYNYKIDVRKKGEQTINYLKKHNKKGVVLAGRPYHIDPAINHGIPELINYLDMAVLSEDSIDHLGHDLELRVLNQWTYHARLYRAAEYVSRNKNLELVQLNSFGCGLDAVTTDQVEEILESKGKIYTHLKIDEVSNLGAAKIRLRSLKAALEERDKKNTEKDINNSHFCIEKEVFTKKNKKEHTILMPQMSPIHFELIETVLRNCGYNVRVLNTPIEEAIKEGLKYVNNDACYPSIITIGQFISELKSGKYDPEYTSLLMSQTGGVCRASNYTGFLRKALKESGFGEVKVISVSAQGIERNPGFNFSYKMINKCIIALLLGDLLSRVTLRTRPYELNKGDSDKLLRYWINKLKLSINSINKTNYKNYVDKIIYDFENIDINQSIKKPKVGIVGEILVKYHPEANNNLIKLLEAEGAEVVMSDLTDFIMYCLYNPTFKHKYLGKGYMPKLISDIGIKYIESYRNYIRKKLKKSQRFTHPLTIYELVELAETMISTGNQSGEGWLLTAEMLEFVENGVENIVCVQPFGCLPNHITGKGMIKGVRRINNRVNIIPLDYDPGASKVNQVNRLKLMMSRAKDSIL